MRQPCSAHHTVSYMLCSQRYALCSRTCNVQGRLLASWRCVGSLYPSLRIVLSSGQDAGQTSRRQALQLATALVGGSLLPTGSAQAKGALSLLTATCHLQGGA